MAYSSTRHSFLTGARPVRRYRHRTIEAKEAFPELEPADATDTSRGRSHVDRIIRDLGDQFAELRSNPDAKNPLSRLTVYTLNAALLVLAFPVGFAMLIFNILGGANLRTTIHVIALTGLAVALANTETGTRILGLG
jgi:hypothetical protein